MLLDGSTDFQEINYRDSNVYDNDNFDSTLINNKGKNGYCSYSEIFLMITLLITYIETSNTNTTDLGSMDFSNFINKNGL